MENYKLFIRSMRVMGKKRFVYRGSIFVMSVTFALFGIMSSLLMKCVVDIAQTGEYERLGYSIAVIVAVGVISLLIYRVATIRYNVEAKRVYGDLSEKVLDAEMSLPYSYYEKHHSGEIVSKVSYDLTKMGDIYGSRLRRVVMPFLQVVAYLVPMFLLSWQLTMCLLAVNSVMMAIELLLLNPMHRISRELSGCCREWSRCGCFPADGGPWRSSGKRITVMRKSMGARHYIPPAWRAAARALSYCAP